MNPACVSYNTDNSGPLQIDYVYVYKCDLHGYEAYGVCLLLVWILILANLLGSTASNYFSPCLASICARLNLSYDVAGVTFLAFGNGAPDVFASITSFSGSADVLIGIGALLGGSVFVTTIVVGSIAIFNPCQIQAPAFFRDIAFHILATSAVTLIAALGETNVFISIFFFLIYTGYAMTVVLLSGKGKSTNPIHLISSSSTQLQTAFWHKPAGNTKPSSTNGFARDTGGYKFLILDESPDSKNDDLDGMDDDTDDGGTVTINLSGGLISSEFSAEIVEDYFSGSNISSVDGEIPKSSSASKHTFDGVTMGDDESWLNGSSSHSQLRESLLNEKESDMVNTISSAADGASAQSRQSRRLQAIYAQQVLLRRRLQRSLLAADWWSYPLSKKIFSVLEFPAVLARDLTIPTVDDEMWSKYHAVLQPLTAPLFLVLISDSYAEKVGLLPTPAFSVILGTVPASVVFLLTHYSYPPKSKVFGTVWVMFAFVMCVSWVYLLAGELVACLTAAGEVFAIPPIYLGLTVLAWGNSIGDFFSNLSVARRGLGEMAVAGCYGGPIFNILMGLGMAMTYACSKSYPHPFKIRFDVSSKVSLAFLYVSLVSTLVVVPLRGFRLEKPYGFYLIALYLVHTAVQGALLFSGSH